MFTSRMIEKKYSNDIWKIKNFIIRSIWDGKVYPEFHAIVRKRDISPWRKFRIGIQFEQIRVIPSHFKICCLKSFWEWFRNRFWNGSDLFELNSFPKLPPENKCAWLCTLKEIPGNSTQIEHKKTSCSYQIL